jgi:hypothetical protein
MHTLSWPRAATVGFLLAAVAAGCNKYDGISDYDRAQMAQKQGVDAIVAQGGKAERKNHGLGDGWAIHLPGLPVTEETLGAIRQTDRVSELHLGRSTVTDAQILSLCEGDVLNRLVALDVSHTEVSDAVLGKLAEVQFLGHLNVTGSKVTQAGLERFKQARQANPKIPSVTKSPKIIGP